MLFYLGSASVRPPCFEILLRLEFPSIHAKLSRESIPVPHRLLKGSAIKFAAYAKSQVLATVYHYWI
jgi:hypothetical protein